MADTHLYYNTGVTDLVLTNDQILSLGQGPITHEAAVKYVLENNIHFNEAGLPFYGSTGAPLTPPGLAYGVAQTAKYAPPAPPVGEMVPVAKYAPPAPPVGEMDAPPNYVPSQGSSTGGVDESIATVPLSDITDKTPGTAYNVELHVPAQAGADGVAPSIMNIEQATLTYQADGSYIIVDKHGQVVDLPADGSVAVAAKVNYGLGKDNGVPRTFTESQLVDKRDGAIYNVQITGADGKPQTGTIEYKNGKYTFTDLATGQDVTLTQAQRDSMIIFDSDPYRSKHDGYAEYVYEDGTGVQYKRNNTDFTSWKTGDKVEVDGKIYTLEISDSGDPYNPKIVFKDENGKVVNIDTSKGGIYGVDEVTTGKPNSETARVNGYGSSDRADIHDQYMHHTHVTQTGGAGDRGEYQPGKTVSLANNPYLNTIVQKSGNILGNKDPKTFSKLDYIATYAGTGQYSVKDLKLTVDALEQNGVTFGSTKQWFKGTDLENIYTEVQGQAGIFKADADALRAEVERIRGEFEAFHGQMTEWSGQASSRNAEVIQCILGKFEVTMGNIDQALEPACTAMSEFEEKLKKLQEEEDKLINPDKTVGWYAKLEQLKLDLDELTTALNNTPKEVFDRWDVDVKGNKTKVMKTNSNYTRLEGEIRDKNTEITTLEGEITAQETLLDGLLLEVLELYYKIKNFTTAVQTFGEFFTAGTEKYKWISSADNIVKFHDSILTEFEDYVKMPVITNLSDYQVGDVVVFDDAHGYVYAISGPFDPLTGTVTIACYDKTGRKIGEDVTIWDQREIVPIKHVRPYDQHYSDYPDTFAPTPTPTPPTPTPPATPTPTPPAPPRPTPTPPAPPRPTPTTQPPTNPPTTVPTNPPTNPPTTVPTNPPTNPPTTPVAIPPPPTNPPTTPQTRPPVGPHTGLDAVYASGDTTQSSAGLGALAGLAVGAAGLGLTGLMDDKDEKDKEEKKEESKEEDSQEKKESVVE